LSFIDIIALLRRLNAYVRSSEGFTFGSFRRTVILGHKERTGPEYISLIVQEPEDIEEIDQIKQQFHSGEHHIDQWQKNSDPSQGALFEEPSSPVSDATLTHTWLPAQSKAHILHRIGRAAFAASERALVFAGFAQLLTGIVVYTGGCRHYFINGCLAHLISKYN
jgi:hypothetical protein